MLKLENESYFERLNSAESYKITGYIEGIPVVNSIPALNANIIFSSLPIKNSNHDILSKNIPMSWNWRDPYYSDDSIYTIHKKEIVLSSSCENNWMNMILEVIGNNFMIQHNLDYKPIFHNNNAPNNAPVNILLDIEKRNGLMLADKQVDHDWYLLNEEDNKVGCYYPDNIITYKILNISTLNIKYDPEIRNTIKNRIYNYGPVLAGFHIFNNFQVSLGNFTKTKGVYIENVDYSNQNSNSPLIEPGTCENKWLGSHLICVIGWGTESIEINNIEKDIFYWLCRNNWGICWGDKRGYFKIAAYPHNKISQFEKLVTVKDRTNNDIFTGGFLFFDTEPPIMNTSIKNIEAKYLDIKKHHNDDNNQKGKLYSYFRRMFIPGISIMFLFGIITTTYVLFKKY